MSFRETLTSTLTCPSTADLWRLRADLLEAGLPSDARSLRVIGEFERFLDQLETGTSSKEYSELASKLDIGAVSGVVLEHLLETGDASEIALRLFSGMLSEGLMVLATRQHVRAWEGELNAVYRQSAWNLYEELWHWARELKPDLAPGERRTLLDRLMAPIHSAETPGMHKALLLGHLFQLLLVSYVSREVKRRGQTPSSITPDGKTLGPDT